MGTLYLLIICLAITQGLQDLCSEGGTGREACDKKNATCEIKDSEHEKYHCICAKGEEMSDEGCRDLCSDGGTGREACDKKNATCDIKDSEPEGYDCICAKGEEMSDERCRDLCLEGGTGRKACDKKNATCKIKDSEPGGYHCICAKGEEMSDEGCRDICSEGATGREACDEMNATCEIKDSQPGGYECICAKGKEMSDEGCRGFCQGNPCENNGTCITYSKSYECICENDFYGKHCEKNSKCDVCVSGTECILEENQNYAKCKCADPKQYFDYQLKTCKALYDCFSTECGDFSYCFQGKCYCLLNDSLAKIKDCPDPRICSIEVNELCDQNNTVCKNEKCECKNGFKISEGAECVKDECSKEDLAKCNKIRADCKLISEEPKCICPPGNILSNGQCTKAFFTQNLTLSVKQNVYKNKTDLENSFNKTLSTQLGDVFYSCSLLHYIEYNSEVKVSVTYKENPYKDGSVNRLIKTCNEGEDVCKIPPSLILNSPIRIDEEPDHCSESLCPEYYQECIFQKNFKYECKCKKGFIKNGQFTNTTTTITYHFCSSNMCENNPCKKDEICQNIVHSPGYSCTKIKMCDNNEHCGNNEECTLINKNKICLCKKNFKLKDGICIDNCEDNECNKDSHCIPLDHDYSCKCSKGFTGRYCNETDINLNTAKSTNYIIGGVLSAVIVFLAIALVLLGLRLKKKTEERPNNDNELSLYTRNGDRPSSPNETRLHQLSRQRNGFDNPEAVTDSLKF